MKEILSLGFACLALLAACGKTHDTNLQGGETNWLSACEDDSSCGVGSCVCDVCSEGCDVDEDCPEGLVCRAPDTDLVLAACGTSERGLCAPECTRDEDCGEGRVCGDGAACTLDDDASSEMNGPYEAFSVAAVAPNAECEFSVDGLITPIGLFDIASGAAADTGGCDDSYRVSLKVASASRDIVQILSAQVRLLTRDQRPIVFNREASLLENPFDFTTTRTLLPAADGDQTAQGIVTIDVIPRSYAQQLDNFDGNQILAEITLEARNVDGAEIAVAPFFYPIDLCVGCLSICLMEDVLDNVLEPADIYGDSCPDNSGQDGRVCIDPDC